MKLNKTLILLTSVLSLNHAYGCTTAFWNTNAQAKMVARTVDLFTPDMPKIIVYPRGTDRNGQTGSNTLTWTSKYGNVVVTEFNSPAASDGINEVGLSAHILYLTGSSYEKAPKNVPSLSNVMWAQYILDNYKTVDEVIKANDTYQLIPTVIHHQKWPLHLSIQDATGDAAVIEFINGNKVVYHGHQYTTMTNEPAYNIQLANLKRYQSFGGNLPLPGDSDPLSRFVRVSTYLKTLPAPVDLKETIAGIFSVIRTAMVPFGAVDTSGNKTVDAWATRWASVADLTNTVYYFNSTTTPNIIWVDLKKLDFSPTAKAFMIDPNDPNLSGDVTKKMSLLGTAALYPAAK